MKPCVASGGEHHRQWGFFFSFFFLFVANFGHLETKNKNGRRGAANCPKEFIFSGKKGPQSPYFKEKNKKKVELAIFIRALVVVFRFLYVAISKGEFEKKFYFVS
jgi:hypothetical protein